MNFPRSRFALGAAIPPRTDPTRHARSVVAVVLTAVTLGACGETYIDEAASSTSTPQASATTAPTLPADATTPELFALLTDELSTLSQAVIDRDDLDRRSARIDAIWTVLEPKLDARTAANTSEVVELAHRSITARRPADADKAYRLLLTVTEAT